MRFHKGSLFITSIVAAIATALFFVSSPTFSADKKKMVGKQNVLTEEQIMKLPLHNRISALCERLITKLKSAEKGAKACVERIKKFEGVDGADVDGTNVLVFFTGTPTIATFIFHYPLGPPVN